MALNGVNLEIKDSEFVAIMGPSGSGKTTLLNIIGALDKPNSGEVIINEKNVEKLKEEEQAKFRQGELGFIFQFFYLQNYLNTLENIALPLVFRGLSWEESKNKAKEAVAIVGLDERINHRPEELSGGERQRVAIARALINNPKILVADEPTGNLDKKNSEMIMEILKKLNKEKGMTIVLVTHDENIGKCATRIIKMNKGEIII